MATSEDSSIKFFQKATSNQWLFVLSQYKDVLKHRAQVTRGSRKGGPQELIKLDNWFQEELPKKIQSRKDRHIIHEELVQITKWKLWRGKNRARLLDLVRINTETAVLQVSRKAFRKVPGNISGAISQLSTLKGIGPAAASAILAAGAPECCPFMADECMLSIPGIEAADYTVAEYMNFFNQIKAVVERLQVEDPDAKWNPHKVELALWTHYWIRESKLNILDKMPSPDGRIAEVKSNNGDSHGKLPTNGGGDKLVDEDSNISVPVSNTSETEEKSNDSSQADEVSSSVKEDSPAEFRRPTGNGSAYNCIEDSKDGLGPSSEENSQQNHIISNEEYSNLSYSNLSSDDLNNSTAENTVDNSIEPSSSSNTTASTNGNCGSIVSQSNDVINQSDSVTTEIVNKRPIDEITSSQPDDKSLEKKARIE